MPSSRLTFDATGHREILLAARWLDEDRRAWLRLCHPAVTAAGWRWTIVGPDDADLVRVQDELPGASIVAAPRQGSEYSLWRALRPLAASGHFAAVHALDLPAAGHASLACFGSRLPLVVSVPHPPDVSRYSGLVGSFERWLLGRTLAGAAAIVAGSADVQEGVLRLFPNLRAFLKKIHTIPEGVDTRRYLDGDLTPGVPLRRELELDDETMLVGYHGPLTCAAGFALLLDAVARLVRHGGVPAFHLAAFGDDTTGEGRDTVSRLGLTEHVTVSAPLTDLPSALEQLDLVVVPAPQATTSRIAREALCAGVPVLATDGLGLQDTPARTVKAGVLAALETSLREALHAPWFAEAAAYAPVACRRFDHHTGAEQLVRLYDQLARGGAPATDVALATGG